MLNNNQKERINKQIAINNAKKKEDRLSYFGLLSTYQLYAVKEFSYENLNPRQYKLFKNVLHGFGNFKKEEVSKMNWETRKKISRAWARGQKIINIFKQQVSNVYANQIFALFDSCKFITDIPASEIDRKNVNINTLKELGINYDDLILLFIQKNLLPKNFFSLK